MFLNLEEMLHNVTWFRLTSCTGVAKRGAFDVLGNLRKGAYICPEKFVTEY